MGVRLIRGSREVRGVGVGGMRVFFLHDATTSDRKKTVNTVIQFFSDTPQYSKSIFIIIYIL